MICTNLLLVAPKQSVSTFIIGMVSLHGAITSPNAGESACFPLIDTGPNQSRKLLSPRYQHRNDVARLKNKKVKISSLRETLGCVKADTPQIKRKVLPLKPHQQNTLQSKKKKVLVGLHLFFFYKRGFGFKLCCGVKLINKAVKKSLPPRFRKCKAQITSAFIFCSAAFYCRILANIPLFHAFNPFHGRRLLADPKLLHCPTIVSHVVRSLALRHAAVTHPAIGQQRTLSPSKHDASTTREAQSAALQVPANWAKMGLASYQSGPISQSRAEVRLLVSDRLAWAAK